MTRRLAPLPGPPLRVAFMGTPELAATSLRALLAGEDQVVGVFSRPDAPRGRGMVRDAPPTARLAREHGIPVLQPQTWKDGAAVRDLTELAPDLVVVAAYGRLLPRAALAVPRFGCINVHASLLPRWRGADPITRAILAGDAETGVTIMEMVLEMDAGAILTRRALPIRADHTSGSLEDELAELGATALREAIQTWREGALSAREQDPAEVTLAPMIRKQDGRIRWQDDAARIERQTRAYDPWPGATTSRQGEPLKLWRAEVLPREAAGPSAAAEPGVVLAVDAKGVAVQTGAGALRLLEVQAPGRRRMDASAYARGAHLAVGERLGDPVE